MKPAVHQSVLRSTHSEQHIPVDDMPVPVVLPPPMGFIPHVLDLYSRRHSLDTVVLRENPQGLYILPTSKPSVTT